MFKKSCPKVRINENCKTKSFLISLNNLCSKWYAPFCFHSMIVVWNLIDKLKLYYTWDIDYHYTKRWAFIKILLKTIFIIVKINNYLKKKSKFSRLFSGKFWKMSLLDNLFWKLLLKKLLQFMSPLSSNFDRIVLVLYDKGEIFFWKDG